MIMKIYMYALHFRCPYFLLFRKCFGFIPACLHGICRVQKFIRLNIHGTSITWLQKCHSGSDFTCPGGRGCQISNQINFIVHCRFEFLVHPKVSRRCSVLRAQSSNGQDLHGNHLCRMCREVRRAIQKVGNMQNDPFSPTNLTHMAKHVHTTEFVRWALTCQVTEYRKYKSSWGGVMEHSATQSHLHKQIQSVFFPPHLTNFHSTDFPANFHTMTKPTLLNCTVN